MLFLGLQVANLQQLQTMVVQAAGLDAASEYFVSMAVADGVTPVALTDLTELAAKAKVQIWPVSAPAPAPTPCGGREFVLMVVANSLVSKNLKVKAAASSLPELQAAVVESAGLDAAREYFVSTAVAEGSTPVALTDLDELAAKAKVQIWELEEAVETEGREFILMVLKNDLVTANAKVKVTAADLRTLKHEIFRAVLPEGLVSLS